jgi:predicted transcriptional regulator
MFTTVPLQAAGGLDLPVREVMHADPVRIDGRASIGAAAERMLTRRVHAILVCDEHDTPIGWMTTGGILHNAARDWDQATARDAITESLVTVKHDATVATALEALLAAGVSHLLVRAPTPVLASDPTPVLGVVSDFDLLTVLAAGRPGSRD